MQLCPTKIELSIIKGLKNANYNRNDFWRIHIYISTQRIVWLLDRQETLVKTNQQAEPFLVSSCSQLHFFPQLLSSVVVAVYVVVQNLRNIFAH